MKVSTKGIYAVEAMVDLAIHSSCKPENIKNIASRRNLSVKYLEQIIAALRRANLIVSTRGAQGGYQLSREPGQITVLDILMAVEKKLIPVDCLEKQTDCGINCEKCVTRNVWKEMWENFESVTKFVTIEDLIVQSKQYEKIGIEYYI